MGARDTERHGGASHTRCAAQEYDQHLGPVNTIQFIDNNSKFVTTGDDKTVRVWEWDIPFAIKYMADPGMHSMPTCTVHPSGKYIAYQSMDNQIKIYTGGERFRPYSKKTFKGHVSSGYACQVRGSCLGGRGGGGGLAEGDLRAGLRVGEGGQAERRCPERVEERVLAVGKAVSAALLAVAKRLQCNAGRTEPSEAELTVIPCVW